MIIKKLLEREIPVFTKTDIGGVSTKSASSPTVTNFVMITKENDSYYIDANGTIDESMFSRTKGQPGVSHSKSDGAPQQKPRSRMLGFIPAIAALIASTLSTERSGLQQFGGASVLEADQNYTIPEAPHSTAILNARRNAMKPLVNLDDSQQSLANRTEHDLDALNDDLATPASHDDETRSVENEEVKALVEAAEDAVTSQDNETLFTETEEQALVREAAERVLAKNKAAESMSKKAADKKASPTERDAAKESSSALEFFRLTQEQLY